MPSAPKEKIVTKQTKMPYLEALTIKANEHAARKRKEQRRKYYLANKDAICAKRKDRYEANKDAISRSTDYKSK